MASSALPAQLHALNTDVTEAVKACRLLCANDIRALAAMLGVPATAQALQLECMGSRYARAQLWQLLFDSSRSRTPTRQRPGKPDAPLQCPPAPRVERRVPTPSPPQSLRASFSPKILAF